MTNRIALIAGKALDYLGLLALLVASLHLGGALFYIDGEALVGYCFNCFFSALALSVLLFIAARIIGFISLISLATRHDDMKLLNVSR